MVNSRGLLSGFERVVAPLDMSDLRIQDLSGRLGQAIVYLWVVADSSTTFCYSPIG